MLRRLFLCALAFLFLPLAPAAEWMQDFDAALAQASAQKKALLLDFTGSDWCVYCVRLRQEILDTPAFEAFAQDKLLLMEVDLPRAKQQPAALQRQNRALAEKYHVQSFPTLLLLSPEGRVLASLRGGRSELSQVTEPLEEGLALGRRWAEAEKLPEAERLPKLLEIYRAMPKETAARAEELKQEIAALDAEDVSGIRRQAAQQVQEKELMEAVKACASPEDCYAVLDAWQEKILPENRHWLFTLRANAMYEAAQSTADLEAAEAMAKQALPCMADEGQRSSMALSISRRYSNKEAIIARKQAQSCALAQETAPQKERRQIMAEVQGAGSDAKALELVAAWMPRALPENKAGLCFLKESLLLKQAESVEDLAAAQAALEESLPFCNAAQAEQVKQKLAERYGDKAALLEKLKAARGR